MRFTEIKQRLSGERVEFPCERLEQTAERVIVRNVLGHAGTLAELSLPAGSVCLAYFWQAHPYNVYHWMDAIGQTLAFYVNLSGPARLGEDYVEWQDLVVDVLIVPDERLGYRVTVLDEEELSSDLDPALLRHIQAALAEVMASWPALVRAVAAHSARLADVSGARHKKGDA